MALQLQGRATEWPVRAIHDTVAAIARQPAYRRSLRASLLARLFRWVGEIIDRLVAALGGTQAARTAAIVVTATLVVLVVLRVVYATQLRAGVGRIGRLTPAGRAGAVDPWLNAQRLALGGRYTDAAHALYRALVNALARRGQVSVHDSKTSGDYARELRSRGSGAYPTFNLFRRRYERVIFGVGACDQEAYAALLHDARPILEEAVAA